MEIEMKGGCRGFSKGRRWRPLRGQAAIFDGIFFLLLVSSSVALMFSFLGDYGTAEAKILRSSHTLNYVQSIGKTLYFLDAGQLSQINDREADLDCNSLRAYASNSISDLIKRDASDGAFDNRFGNSEEPNAPGKLALRCALHELMKPVTGAGFDYNAEILSADLQLRPFAPTPNSPELVTNLKPSDSLYLVASSRPAGGEVSGGGCDSISQALKEKQLLAISTPFRVFDEEGNQHDHQLRICMWPSERK